MLKLLNSSFKLNLTCKTYLILKRMSIFKSSVYKNITLNNLKLIINL